MKVELPFVVFIIGVAVFIYIAIFKTQKRDTIEVDVMKEAEAGTTEKTKEISEKGKVSERTEYRNKYADILGIFAHIELISSIILAICIWTSYGTMGIDLGFGILLHGIVVLVILLTLKTMAKDIKDIKNPIM